MHSDKTIFEKTYDYYLNQLKALSFESIAEKIGVKLEGESLKIRLFKNDYAVFKDKIIGPSGKQPAFDVCVLLSQYLLRCPDEAPQDKSWVSYKDFKDAGPLIGYFSNEVESSIAGYFSKRRDELKKAGGALGGHPPALDVNYDLALQFDALPMIPVILLFNDKDEEFSATCSVLFERRAEVYLDCECIAMLGGQLVYHLKKSLKSK